ncbi:MAG TPA: hypothetical protein VGE57_02050 [Solimonas sp.]
MKNRFLSSLWLAPLLLAAPVWAGGVATIESGDDGQTFKTRVEYEGSHRLRIEAPEQGGYLLVRDGKAYSVVTQGGQTMVIDMAGMMQMVGGMAQQNQDPMGGGDVHEFVSLSDAGRSETVAGISGRVHTLTYADKSGKRHTETMVLSKDARARDLTMALTAMGEIMARNAKVPETAGSKRLHGEILGNGQGVLRYGTAFRVVSFDGGKPAAARFELPAQPMQMPNFGGAAGAAASGNGAGTSAGASAGIGGGALGDLFGQKTQRQQQRVEDRTNQEVDQATDSAIDKALDKAFDKLFGR